DRGRDGCAMVRCLSWRIHSRMQTCGGRSAGCRVTRRTWRPGWPGTGSVCARSGFAAFRDRRINAMLKKILTAWCEFLNSGDSRYVLNDSPSGWKCAAARRAVGIKQYQYEPDDEYSAFASWNDFFTRR